MAKLEIKGNVVYVGELESFSDTAKKRTIVINESEETPQGSFTNDVAVDFWMKHLDKIERVKVGDYVEITAAARSRDWKDKDGNVKYFTNINGFFCKNEGARQTKQESASEHDDMPF